MKGEIHNNLNCPIDDISAYIDGELSHSREIELDLHFVSCRPCSDELNFQKQFLGSLDSSLKQERELPLPADFARQIVANAESTVAGLRRPRELYNAAFICAGLLLFGLFALGTDADRVLGGLGTAFEQAGAVGGFFAKVVYSIFLGFAVIIRSLAAQLQVADISLLIVPASIGLALLMYVSRRFLRTARA